MHTTATCKCTGTLTTSMEQHGHVAQVDCERETYCSSSHRFNKKPGLDTDRGARGARGRCRVTLKWQVSWGHTPIIKLWRQRRVGPSRQSGCSVGRWSPLHCINTPGICEELELPLGPTAAALQSKRISHCTDEKVLQNRNLTGKMFGFFICLFVCFLLQRIPNNCVDRGLLEKPAVNIMSHLQLLVSPLSFFVTQKISRCFISLPRLYFTRQTDRVCIPTRILRGPTSVLLIPKNGLVLVLFQVQLHKMDLRVASIFLVLLALAGATSDRYYRAPKATKGVYPVKGHGE